FANAGLPMVAIFLPPAWLLLLPIIIIEGWYGVVRHGLPLKRSLMAQAAANALSTLVGLPLAWVIVLLAGVLVAGPIVQHVPPLAVPLYPILLITGSAWLGPGAEETWWRIPLAILLLAGPVFLVVVVSETLVVRRFFPTLDRGVIRRWIIRSNLITYSLLLTLTIAAAQSPRAQGALTDLFSPVHHGLLAMLAPILDPDRETRDGTTPLMNATAASNYGRMRKLIADGADVNATDNFGWTALHEAAGRGNQVAIRILLGAGARVSIRQPATGATPLHQAAYLSDSQTVRVLIAGGAKPDERDDDGWTPLMTAAMMGRSAVVGALIEAGADVNARSKTGWTALKEGRSRGYDALCERLERAGAIDYPDGT